jgi:hypothetical protein
MDKLTAIYLVTEDAGIPSFPQLRKSGILPRERNIAQSVVCLMILFLA